MGDSRAILVRLCPEESKSPFTVIPLSRDHKPELAEERLRIEQKGGEIQAYLDQNNQEVGPQRVWVK